MGIKPPRLLGAAGLGDMLQDFGLAICAVRTLAKFAGFPLFARDCNQVIVMIDPGVGQHSRHFLRVHITANLVPGYVQLTFDNTDIVRAVGTTTASRKSVMFVHLTGFVILHHQSILSRCY